MNTLLQNNMDNTRSFARTSDNLHTSGIQQRLQLAEKITGKNPDFLSGKKMIPGSETWEGNIENFIGLTQIPTGIAGPLQVNGQFARGLFHIPLATTEGALVASYHRGAKACTLAGGVSTCILHEGVQRAPLFRFQTVHEMTAFMSWVIAQEETFRFVTRTASKHALLRSLRCVAEGNQLVVVFEFFTGDAAGQNMVTFCTEEICNYILKNALVQPLRWYIEGNYAGDKKATANSFIHGRGKKVTAEAVIAREVVETVLKTTTRSITDYWLSSTMAVVQSGALGAQGHYANGLAALFLATGQDVACISEAATGMTRMECMPDGALYISVTLPNLIVGTVGGGTGLPTQRECLEIMQCAGNGCARRFAEIAAALVLAGELSIAAALAAGHFSSAHKQLGRKHENK